MKGSNPEDKHVVKTSHSHFLAEGRCLGFEGSGGEGTGLPLVEFRCPWPALMALDSLLEHPQRGPDSNSQGVGSKPDPLILSDTASYFIASERVIF